MAKVIGLHIRDTKNAGDRASCPLDYFWFPGEVISGDMRAPPEISGVVIYGGGSIIASPDFRPNKRTVAWGVGHHERSPPWHDAMMDAHTKAAKQCGLYFCRDAIDGFEVVPDVSCMHPAFDGEDKPIYEVVRYSAARRVDVSNGIDPHMTNEDGTIDDAVRFLSSGETVITSSYHGAYWAGLLGRRVKVVSWGSKFDYLPNMSLAECRAANEKAYVKVLEWIG